MMRKRQESNLINTSLRDTKQSHDDDTGAWVNCFVPRNGEVG
jgi:hypothetical protein